MCKLYKTQKLSKFAQKTLDIENGFPYNSRPQTMSRLKERRRRLQVEALKKCLRSLKTK